jgi:hypothetical protein
LIARAAQLSARLTSAIDTAVPIRTAAAVNENQVRVAAPDVADRHGLSVWHSDHQTQSAGGYPVLQHNGYSFCQISWLQVDMTVAFTDHHIVERQSAPYAREWRTRSEQIPNERFIGGLIAPGGRQPVL